MLILFSNIKKGILTNLKRSLFTLIIVIIIIIIIIIIVITTIIIILKETIYIKIIIQIDKHKVKYIITACIPIVIIKNFLLFFFIIYKNERKEHKFWQQNYQKKNFYNKNIKIFKIFKSILMLIKY